MNRQNNVPFRPSAVPEGAAPLYKQGHARVPKDFLEAMKHIPVKAADKSSMRKPELATKAPLARRRTTACKWKSSFKPVGDEEDDNTQEQNTCSSEMVELYDPGKSDSEMEVARIKALNHHSSEQDPDNKLECQRLSPGTSRRKKSRWDSSYSGPGSRLFGRHDFGHESRPRESPGLSSANRLPEQLSYSPHSESLDRLVYSPVSSCLDHRVCSPERTVHSSTTQEFPATYGVQKTNGEDKIRAPERQSEMTTAVRLSPPKLQRGFKHHLGQMEKGLDQIAPATEVTGDRRKIIVMDKEPITCDLCEVELANGQELEDHLDSKSHWETLEYIQQNNNYDDLAIAFLQEVMFYKCRQCSRAIEHSALPALQENDHMTKVEMFHCAACNAFVATSASSVQTHITSQEHLSNTTAFEVQQRRTCLDNAETIMEELKPHFEHFLKGDSPFE